MQYYKEDVDLIILVSEVAKTVDNFLKNLRYVECKKCIKNLCPCGCHCATQILLRYHKERWQGLLRRSSITKHKS